jgi:uncharacterized membrane protein YcaP (DUF421 family)
METIARAVSVYIILLLLFRIAGKRTLSTITTFDFVLLLIISEAVQNGMVGNDYSVINALLLVTTLAILDVALSLLKQRWPRLEHIIEGLPLVILEEGRPLRDRMAKERVDEEDILAAAREHHGLERLDQIKYAVLERSGGISIIPKQS